MKKYIFIIAILYLAILSHQIDDLSSGIKDLVEKLDTTGKMSLEEIREKFYKINPALKGDRIFNSRLPSIYGIYKCEKEREKEKDTEENDPVDNLIFDAIWDLIEILDSTGEMSLEEIRKEFYEINPEFEENKLLNNLLPSIYSIHKYKKEIEKEKVQEVN